MAPNTKQQSPEAPALTIATRNFGTITVRQDQIIMLAPGLLGFADLHRYVLIEYNQDSPFLWMQSLDNPELAFVVVDPVAIMPGYQVAPTPEVLSELEVEGTEELKVLVILTIPPGQPQDITANLMGPIIINLQNRRGKQLVVDNTEYSHKHRLLPAEEE